MVSSEIPGGRPGSRPAVQTENPYDTHGRARPIYGVRTPRPPGAWRPGRLTLLLMGLVPGVRSLVSGQIRTGAPYALLGFGTLLGTLLLLTSYPTTLEALRNLRIQPRFIILHAAAVLALVTAYELLRFGASLEENPSYASRTPRFLAALWLPALFVVTGGPAFVAHAPRLVESAWFAALVLVLGAAPAVVWCALGDMLRDPERQRTFRWGCAATLFTALLVLAGLALGLGAPWSKAAREVGFRLLPGLLG